MLVSDTVVLTVCSYVDLPNLPIRFEELIFWHLRADVSLLNL